MPNVNLGIGMKAKKARVPSLDPVVQNLFNRMGVQPTGTRRDQINSLVVDLKSNGLWDLMDCLYMIAAQDAQSRLLNWKGNYDNLTVVGSTTFVVDKGDTGDSTTNYLRSDYNPSVGTKLFATNTCHNMLVPTTNWSGGSGGLVLAVEATGSAPVSHNASNSSSQLAWRSNFSVSSGRVFTTGINTAAPVPRLINRVSSSSVQLWRDASLIATTGSTATGLPNGTLKLDEPRRIGAMTIGAALTDTQSAYLQNRIKSYLTDIGAFV